MARTAVSKKRSTWWKTALGVFFTAVMLFPVYWMVNVSFTQRSDLRANPPHLFPTNPTLEGYQAVAEQQLPALGVSLVVGLGCVILTIALAAPAAYAIALLKMRGGKTLNFILLVAQMIPAVVMSMGFYAIYVRLGLLNSLPGLILADSTVAVPFGVLLFTAFMSGIPRELLQAARVDGAGAWRTFRSVVMPISRNSAITVALFAFLWAWSDFIFASTLARNAEFVPVTLSIYAYIGNNTTQWNAIMATAVVASVPAAVLLVFAQRYVAAGVTAGAVKD
ncbi:carbohydrate ABC transporter permease [Demequina capsici]|uniref:Carbohydrate ABC transporter permease n=1 Tax=Demequina capsici TaxID=3075620 RepID=A0AA96J9N3_9MICO|nr:MULTISPECIES: carbohydrate ABC transporter permease [unclassified Demequina]WNM23741.1 carbohydrate ABC transporter permease [Demequina sp. OYTSA14]WNM26580.1 carbohydrate ABC transporter permease [Demequina sp. PMTSA13]